MNILTNRNKRTQRVRFKIKKKNNLRLSLFRSNKFIYAQLIDDSVGKTLLSSSSIQKEFKNVKGSPKEIAFQIGESIGKKILENKIKKKYALIEEGIFFMDELKNLQWVLGLKELSFRDILWSII